LKIAVLGGGFQGVCVALELAARGQEVDLYDENDSVITQAGAVSEGKIHLGFTYANDPTLRSAELMIRGALHFMKNIDRWVEMEGQSLSVSQPFYYGIHSDTMVTEDEIISYFHEVEAIYREMKKALKLNYLGDESNVIFEKLNDEKARDIFFANKILSAYKTIERAVDSQKLAVILRACILACKKISFIDQAQVIKIENDQDRLRVYYRKDKDKDKHEYVSTYDRVVNTLWHGRLKIDASLNLVPNRDWLYRYKLGIRFKCIDDISHIPSVTLILGSFGDIVNYDGQKLYISWYPSGMVDSSKEIQPPDWNGTHAPDKQLTEEQKMEIFDNSLEALSSIIPGLQKIKRNQIIDKDIRGGVIFSWGKTDIDDIDSELHKRYEIGVHSNRNYHSIDTGKYTMAPLFAVEVGNRILGQP